MPENKIKKLKSKITKILSSEENSKRTVPINQMAKPKAQTHQTNG